MAIPTELGVSFTPAEVDSMKTALNTVTAILRSKAEFNLSNQERNKLHIISNDRFPFARKSVVDYGVSFP